MELSTSTISNEIDKSIQEEFSVSQAAIDEIKLRKERGEKPESISNEEIKKNDPILDTYKVLDDAVHGGMGSVWRVHHESWNVDLAMKRPQPRYFAEAGDTRKEEFIRECENWINLGLHPNIVSCYYVREIGGVPTIFSEWMDNGSLKDRIRDGSLYEGTEEEVQERILDIAIQTARGLQYSHENNLIHQDVKPGNILLTKNWDAKVADFGLAKAQSQLTENEKPVSNGYTIQYCPREQAEGAPAEKWMDVYAWALTVLEMYAGKRLWETGAEAKEHCEEYFRQCRIPASTAMQALLTNCLTDPTNDFLPIENALKDEYKNKFGHNYPRSTPKATDTVGSLNNRALSFLDLGKTEEAEHIFRSISAKDLAEAEYNYLLYQLKSDKIGIKQAMSSIKNTFVRYHNFQAAAAVARMTAYDGSQALESKYLEDLSEDEKIRINSIFEQSAERIEPIELPDTYEIDKQTVLQKDLQYYRFKSNISNHEVKKEAIYKNGKGKFILRLGKAVFLSGSEFGYKEIFGYLEIYRITKKNEEEVCSRGFADDIKPFAWASEFNYFLLSGDRLIGITYGTEGYQTAYDISEMLDFAGDWSYRWEALQKKEPLYAIKPDYYFKFFYTNDDESLLMAVNKQDFRIYDSETGELLHSQNLYTNYNKCFIDDKLRYVLFYGGDVTTEFALYNLKKKVFSSTKLYRDPVTYDFYAEKYRLIAAGEYEGKPAVFIEKGGKRFVYYLPLDQQYEYQLSQITSLKEIVEIKDQIQKRQEEIRNDISETNIKKALKDWEKLSELDGFALSADFDEIHGLIAKYCARKSIKSCVFQDNIRVANTDESLVMAYGENIYTSVYKKLRKYNLNTGEQIWESEPIFDFNACDISQDGKYLASKYYEYWGRDPQVAIIDLDTGRALVKELKSETFLGKKIVFDDFIRIHPSGSEIYCRYCKADKYSGKRTEKEILVLHAGTCTKKRVVKHDDPLYKAIINKYDTNRLYSIIGEGDRRELDKDTDEDKIVFFSNPMTQEEFYNAFNNAATSNIRNAGRDRKGVYTYYRILSNDGQHFYSFHPADRTISKYTILYHYEFPGFQDWDEMAQPVLRNFLEFYPHWNEENFSYLMQILAIRGLGYLKPEGVRKRLLEYKTAK